MNPKTSSLKKRTFIASGSVLGGQLFSQFLRFGSNLILTRLLIPEMFGVMAIVNVLMYGFTMFSDIGLFQSIVRSKQGEEQDFLNTAWTIQIIRGGLIFALSIVVSIVWYYLNQNHFFSSDTAYGNEKLPFLIALMSLTAVISGFNSIQLLLLNRKLMMGKLITLELISQILGILVMIYLSWKTQEIWGLAIGAIVVTLVKMLLSHTQWVGGKSKLCWNKAIVTEIFSYGKWVFLSSLLYFLLIQGDKILLGGLVSAETLGIYTVAFFLATAIKELLVKVVNSVFFPVLSEINRNNPSQLQSTYYKIRVKVDILSMFSAGILFSLGQDIVNFLYDDRYSDAGWMLKILSLTLISVGYQLANQCYLSIGKPKLEVLENLFQVIALYISIPVGHMLFGLQGVIWAITLVFSSKILLSTILMKKYVFFSFRDELTVLPVIGIGWTIGEIFRVILGFRHDKFLDFIDLSQFMP